MPFFPPLLSKKKQRSTIAPTNPAFSQRYNCFPFAHRATSVPSFFRMRKSVPILRDQIRDITIFSTTLLQRKWENENINTLPFLSFLLLLLLTAKGNCSRYHIANDRETRSDRLDPFVLRCIPRRILVTVGRRRGRWLGVSQPFYKS